MTFDLLKELKRIYKHFENIDLEQFERDLIECGFGKIKPGPLATDEVLTEEDIAKYREIIMKSQTCNVNTHNQIVIKINLKEINADNKMYCKFRKGYKFKEDIKVGEESSYIITLQQDSLHICNNYEVA